MLGQSSCLSSAACAGEHPIAAGAPTRWESKSDSGHPRQTYPLEAARAGCGGVLEPVEVHSIVPALVVHAGILMPCHVYVPVLIQPLPALRIPMRHNLSKICFNDIYLQYSCNYLCDAVVVCQGDSTHRISGNCARKDRTSCTSKGDFCCDLCCCNTGELAQCRPLHQGQGGQGSGKSKRLCDDGDSMLDVAAHALGSGGATRWKSMLSAPLGRSPRRLQCPTRSVGSRWPGHS